MPNASNVWSGFSFRGGDGETLAATRDVAGTFFDLCALQDEYRESPGAVVEVDMYNAGSALGLSDDELARRRSTTCCEGVSAIACLATSSSRTSPCFDSRAG